VDEIADKLAKEWRDSGETLESMLSICRKYGQNLPLKNRKVFLDTRVVFAAVLSPTEGARKFH